MVYVYKFLLLPVTKPLRNVYEMSHQDTALSLTEPS